VYVDLGDYGGPDHEARAVAACERLQALAPNHDLRPYVVRAGAHVAHLAETMERGRMLAFRRFLYRVAQHIAERERAWGVVTGEALGQKSSQTARNFAVTSPATDLPIHRPLLTMDKPAIVERAKAIGTFADSTIPAGCNRFAPTSPETHGVRSRIERAEPDDLFERAARAAAGAERIEF
jgi:thiamine biosynthesis protein ThiI